MARSGSSLKERTSDIEGDNDWYESRKNQASGPVGGSGRPLDNNEQDAFSNIVNNYDKTADKETNANTKDGQSSAVSDAEKNLNKKDTPFNYAPGKPARRTFRSRFTKRNTTVGGVITSLIATAAIGITTSLPTLYSEYANSILVDKIGEVQTGEQAAYRRTRFNKFSDIFSREGRLAGAIIRDMELRGYVFTFDPADNNRILAVTPPGSNVSVVNTPGGQLEKLFDDYLTKNKPIISRSKWKGDAMDAFFTRHGVGRKAIVQASPDDPPDAKTAVNQKVRAATSGDNVRVVSSIDGIDVTPEEIDANKDAVSAVAEPTGILDETIDRLDNGVTLANTGILTDGFVDGSVIAGITLADEASRGVNLKGVAKAGLSTEIVNKLCTLKNKILAGFAAARIYRNLATIRLAMAYIGANDAQRAGIANTALFGALMSNISSPDSNGQSFGESEGIRAALNNNFSRNNNIIEKESFGLDGKRTGITGEIADTLDGNVAGQLTGRRTCAIATNGGFQIAAGVVEVAATVASGGTAGVAGTTVKTAIKTGVSRVVKQSLSRKGLSAIALGVAVELSFEALTSYAQLQAERSLLVSVTGQEQGRQLGDLLAAGAGSANKQRALQAGFVPATSEQYAKVHNDFMIAKQEAINESSLYTRLFDLKNTDSYLYRNFVHVPTSVGQVGEIAQTNAQSLALNPFKLSSDIARNTGTYLGGETYAQLGQPDIVAFDEFEITSGSLTGTKLATDAAGNIQTILRQDIANIDAYENQDFLASKGHLDKNLGPGSDEFKEHYEACVVNVDTFTTLENDDPHDCMATKEITKRFKAHLAHLDFLSGLRADFLPGDLGGSNTLKQAASDAQIKEVTEPLPSTRTITPEGVVLHQIIVDSQQPLGELMADLQLNNVGYQYVVRSNGEIYQLTEKPTDYVVHTTGGSDTTIGVLVENTASAATNKSVLVNQPSFQSTVSLIEFLSFQFNIPTTGKTSVVCGEAAGVHKHSTFESCGSVQLAPDAVLYNAVLEEVNE